MVDSVPSAATAEQPETGLSAASSTAAQKSAQDASIKDGAAAAEEVPDRPKNLQACSSCGSFFAEDAMFCRKCGLRRPGPEAANSLRLPSAPGRTADETASCSDEDNLTTSTSQPFSLTPSSRVDRDDHGDFRRKAAHVQIERKTSMKSNATVSGKLGGFWGKRIEWATAEDLKAVNSLIRSEISKARAHAHDVAENLAEGMKKMVAAADVQAKESNAAREQVLADAKACTAQCCRELREELTTAMAKTEGRLDAALQSVRDSLDDVGERRLAELSQRLDSEIQRLSRELTAQEEEREASMKALVGKHREELEAVDADLGKKTFANRQVADLLEHQVESIKTVQLERDTLQHAALADVEAKISLRVEQHARSVMEVAEKCDDLVCSTRSMAKEQIGDLREDHEARMIYLERTFSSFHKSVAEAASVPIRRVEWVIRDVARHLKECLQPQDSQESPSQENLPCWRWLSPKFDAAGAHNLQLEVQFLRPTSPQGGHGVALSLWGAEGLYLVFKLTIGEANGISSRLTHAFDGRTPCSTRWLCKVADQVCFEDDTLKVGFEVIESVSTGDCLSAEKPSALEDKSCSMPDGKIVAHRYLNHGTLEMVQEEVDRMRSRMTRRVEWKIEQASMLLKCFPEGESLCSATFLAAGLEGLQLVFFPSGYTGAKEGYCSLFFFCPAGTTLRCWLSAGKQKREARISFEQPGFFGRTNFCRFENCIDPADDSVLLILEIEEAQQTEKQSLSHASAVTNGAKPDATAQHVDNVSSAASLIDAAARELSAGASAGADAADPVQAAGQRLPKNVNSVVKLQRLPGKQGLEDVKHLPSIWTSKTAGNIEDALEGYHRFSDMRPVRRPGTNKTSRRPPGGSMQRVDEEDAPSSIGYSVVNSAETSRSDLWKAPRTPRTMAHIVPLEGVDARTPRLMTPGRNHKYGAYA